MSKKQTVRVKMPVVSSDCDGLFEGALMKIIEPLEGYSYPRSLWMHYTSLLPPKERFRKRRALERIARLAQ